RPDGAAVFGSGESAFLLAYSAKAWSQALSGDSRNDDIASLDPDTWYDVKPSVKRKREEKAQHKAAAAKRPRNKAGAQRPEDNTDHRGTWQLQLAKLRERTEERELRLYVNYAGYSTLKKKTTDHARGIVDGRLKHVHAQHGVVRIIIDQTNFRVLFRSEQQQRLILQLHNRAQAAKRQL